jgi:hypothetical protein
VYGRQYFTGELLNLFNSSPNVPTSAALVQQRSKLLPSAFEKIFHDFTANATSEKHIRAIAFLLLMARIYIYQQIKMTLILIIKE